MARNNAQYWSAHEVRSMLTIMIDNHYGPVVFLIGTRRNEHAFRRSAQELALLGYQRVSRQCRSKFKVLRQQFNAALLNFGPNPAPQNQSPYWAEMKILWRQANRPHPAHAYPAAAGPAQDIGLRHMARIRVLPGANAPLQIVAAPPERDNEEQEEDVEAEENEIAPGDDVMLRGVRRQELEAVIAVVQDLAQRVAAIEAELEEMRAQRNRPRHRRR